MLKSGVYTRDRICSLHIAQIYFGLDIADIMIIASDHGSFTGKIDLFTIAEGQAAPGRCRIVYRLI